MNQISDAVTSTVSSAVIEALHADLSIDADGRLGELPALLEPFEKFRESVRRYGGTAFDVSSHPHILPGRYGVLILESASLQFENQTANRFHAFTESLSNAWASIKKNAESDRPLLLTELGITEKQIVILRALAHLTKLEVEITLTTEDGVVSKFPRATLNFLPKGEISQPPARPVAKLLTGVDQGKNKEVFVRLEFSQWIQLNFTTFDFVSKIISKGVTIHGTIEVIDGVWTMQTGTFSDAQKTRELPF